MPIQLQKQTPASVASPAANTVSLFIDNTDGLLKLKTEAGAVIDLSTTTGILSLLETTTPSTEANKVKIYSKDVGGTSELFALNDQGVETQITTKGKVRGDLTNTTVKTSAYTAVVGDFVRCNISGGSFTVTLPAGHTAGEQIAVKMVSAAGGNTLTIDGNGSETIDGSLTLVLTTDYEWAYLRSDGTNWMQVG